MQRRSVLKSKQTVNSSQDWYKIPSCITYFEINIICLRQPDSASRLYAKEFRLFTKNCLTRKEIIHSSCMLFLSPQYCCFRRSEFNNSSLLYQNEGAVYTVTRTSTSLSFKFIVETIIHHFYCMPEEKSFIWLPRVWFHHMFSSKQGEMFLLFKV